MLLSGLLTSWTCRPSISTRYPRARFVDGECSQETRRVLAWGPGRTWIRFGGWRVSSV